MAEPGEIVKAIEAVLRAGTGTGTSRDLGGRRILVTAGPTHEAIDPVRYLGNRSSGRMGFAIAARAAARGADVTLIAGPVALATPAGVRRIDVESAAEMQRAVEEAMGADLGKVDALVMAAAVADFRAAQASDTKIKKDDGVPSLALTKNPDILAVIGKRRGGRLPVLVGFALETGDDALVLAYAKAKVGAKKVDFVVANAAHESLGQTTNRVAFVSADRSEPRYDLTHLVGVEEVDHRLDRVVGLAPRDDGARSELREGRGSAARCGVVHDDGNPCRTRRLPQRSDRVGKLHFGALCIDRDDVRRITHDREQPLEDVRPSEHGRSTSLAGLDERALRRARLPEDRHAAGGARDGARHRQSVPLAVRPRVVRAHAILRAGRLDRGQLALADPEVDRLRVQLPDPRELRGAEQRHAGEHTRWRIDVPRRCRLRMRSCRAA
jgi:hypothetical protein